MKVNIFWSHDSNKIQEDVQRFLDTAGDKIEVWRVLQSESQGNLTISIWYREKN